MPSGVLGAETTGMTKIKSCAQELVFSLEREALNYYKVSGNECFIAKKEKENEAGDY